MSATEFGLVVGGKYHFQGAKSGKNLAVMPDGSVHSHGGTGEHATFTCEAGGTPGTVKLVNSSGGYLGIGGDGQLKRGEGHKWCDLTVSQVDGNIIIRSPHGDWGVGFDDSGEIRDPSLVKQGHMAQFKVHDLSAVKLGTRVHFENRKSGKNLAVMPNGDVHAHGGNGDHATWHVHGRRGHYQFKNESGSWLACKDGKLVSGGGGKHCDFIVSEHDGHVLIRTAEGDFGVGFKEDGEEKQASNVKEGHMAQFKVVTK